MTIEDIAAKNPDAIIKYPINITKGMSPEDAHIIATKMKFSTDKVAYAFFFFFFFFSVFFFFFITLEPRVE